MSIEKRAYQTYKAAIKSARAYTRRTGVTLSIQRHRNYDRNGDLLQEWYTRTYDPSGIGDGGTIAGKYTVDTIGMAEDGNAQG